eukprot:7113246-Pyramimonas_sp.AAC.1
MDERTGRQTDRQREREKDRGAGWGLFEKSAQVCGLWRPPAAFQIDGCTSPRAFCHGPRG